MKDFKVVLLGGFAFLLFSVSSLVHAIDVSDYFDKNVSYDIYLQGQDHNLPVIKAVEIVKIEEINGKMFLVVKPSDFTFSPYEGYILFESVTVILPNKKIQLQQTDTIRIQSR